VSDVDIVVVDGVAEAARLVAERLADQAREGGNVVLTGGSTPSSIPTGAASSSGGGTSAACRPTTSARITA
jgi:uncharacterized membrane protein YgcG